MRKITKPILLMLLIAPLLLFLSGHAKAQLTSIKLTGNIDGPKGVGDVVLVNPLGASDLGLTTGAAAAQLELFRSDNTCTGTVTTGVCKSAGTLVFAVDINEAASGTEKASSQGVAVYDAWLEVIVGTTTGTTTKIYGSRRNYSGSILGTRFYTQTTAWIYGVQACQGADPSCTPTAMPSTRSEYYTLLGDSGSSRITPNLGKVGSVNFDSTLTIPVADPLDTVTSAILHVRLVNTGTKPTDAEAFYDFSAGFEDLAIVTKQIAYDLDVLVPQETTFQQEAPAVELSDEAVVAGQTAPNISWLYYPSAGAFYTAAYEDLKPNIGDYDFNDAVVAYQYKIGVDTNVNPAQVVHIQGIAYLIARGASYIHDWYLDIPVPSTVSFDTTAPSSGKSCQTWRSPTDSAPATASCLPAIVNDTSRPWGSQYAIRWQAFTDTKTIFPGQGTSGSELANTSPDFSVETGPKAVFSLTLAAPRPQLALTGSYDMTAADPWLYVRNTAQSVRLTNVDPATGLPFAMLMPDAWKVPNEFMDMGNAYPGLVPFIQSGKTSSTDWYLNPVTSAVRPKASGWAW